MMKKAVPKDILRFYITRNPEYIVLEMDLKNNKGGMDLISKIIALVTN